MTDLLPSNATALERAVATACADMVNIAIPIRDLWNAERCPEKLLPILAWAFSVDRWDDTWAEPVKRGVIKASRYIHQHKGTLTAIRGVVESLGYIIKITEWWQTEPHGQRGTFALDVGVLDSGITDQMFLELEHLIDDAKPLSRHLIGLRIHLETRGTIYVGAYSRHGDVVTVYPWYPQTIEVMGEVRYAGIPHIIETTTIYP